MSESQQRLRDELQLHTSLIHSLRCVDYASSTRILGQLRGGAYDGTLLGRDAPHLFVDGERTYPWERTVDTGREIPKWNSNSVALPYAGMTPGQGAWESRDTAGSAWPSESSVTPYSQMDGAAGKVRTSAPHGRLAQETEAPDGAFSASPCAARPQFSQLTFQYDAARYGALQLPSSLKLPARNERMPDFGQATSQYGSRTYPSDEPPGATLLSIEDPYRGRR